MSNVSRILVVRPPTEVDADNAPEFAQTLGEALEQFPDVLVIDCGGVSFMDSMGIEVIRAGSRILEENGGRLSIRNAPGQVRLMLDLASEHDG